MYNFDVPSWQTKANFNVMYAMAAEDISHTSRLLCEKKVSQERIHMQEENSGNLEVQDW